MMIHGWDEYAEDEERAGPRELLAAWGGALAFSRACWAAFIGAIYVLLAGAIR